MIRALILPLAFALPARAQPADTLARAAPSAEWRAGLLGTYEGVGNDQADWHTAGVSLGRKAAGVSWNAELLRARRFGQTDAAGVADLYADLRPGTYGNLRVQAAPGATVLPGLDVSAGLYTSVARVWEAGAAYRVLRFEDARVRLITLSRGRYAGPFFVQARATGVPRGTGLDASGALLVRRYYGGADDFAEVLAGGGREVVTLGAGPRFDVRRTAFVAARVQRRLRGPFVLTGGAGYVDDAVFPRWHATAGAGLRW
jgi:YaiO family outer membrane protein